MYDEALGKLQEARALLLEERDSGANSRELSITVTEIDTAILWRQEDLRVKRPATDEREPDPAASCEGRCIRLTVSHPTLGDSLFYPLVNRALRELVDSTGDREIHGPFRSSDGVEIRLECIS